VSCTHTHNTLWRVQARAASAAQVPFITDLRAIYTAANRHRATASEAAKGDSDREGQGLDFLSHPDPTALTQALHRRVKQLVEEVEAQDSDLRAMEVGTRFQIQAAPSTLV
jgi:hypothetical protein